MKRLFFGLIALAVVAGLSSCRGHEPGARSSFVTSLVSRKLDLTPEQRAKFEAAQTAFEDARKAGAAERAKDLEVVKQQILSDKLDASVARSLIKAREAKIEASFDAVFAKVADFHASLTAEQKKEASEMLEKFADKWK